MRNGFARPEDGAVRWVTGPTAFERTRRHGGVPAASRADGKMFVKIGSKG